MTGVVLDFVGQEGLAKLYLCRMWSHALCCKYSAIKGNLGLADDTVTVVKD